MEFQGVLKRKDEATIHPGEIPGVVLKRKGEATVRSDGTSGVMLQRKC